MRGTYDPEFWPKVWEREGRRNSAAQRPIMRQAMQAYSEEYKERQYRLPDGPRNLMAHDVRHLQVCCTCGGLADDRAALRPTNVRGWEHPRCCYDRIGLDGVLKLPQLDQDRFCLSDMEPADMKQFLTKRK